MSLENESSSIAASTPTASILLIGNEILSGRTHDKNVPFIAENLKKMGIHLKEVRIVPDLESPIIQTVKALSLAYDYVFTTGGIGATHDDITAETIAKAFDVPLVIDPEAQRRLQEFYQDRLNENRLRMARIPKGATLIDNPVSVAPGFQIKNVYCMAGMPNVLQGMFQSIKSRLQGGLPFISYSVRCNLLEGDIAKDLSDLQKIHHSIDIGSYPFYTPQQVGVSLVIQGQDKEAVVKAFEDLLELVNRFQGTIFQKDGPDSSNDVND